MIDEEKKLYPLVQEHLIKKKFCIPEYVGNELSMGAERHMRADVYGISKVNNEKIIHLLEGKLYLKGRGKFSKVLCEAIPLLDFADLVYIFGISKEKDFETVNKKYMEICKLLGIGLLIFDEKGNINEILEANKNEIKDIDKKEIILRIFTKNLTSPISHLILQATYEYTIKNEIECAQFIEVYNTLFSDINYKEILKKILGEKYSLEDIGMRTAFQKEYGGKDYFIADRMNRAVDDYICLTKKGIEKCKESILLD